MLISATLIRRPRKQRRCTACGQPIEGPMLRLFGAAEPGDEPWPMYLHPLCGLYPLNAKVERALREGGWDG